MSLFFKSLNLLLFSQLVHWCEFLGSNYVIWHLSFSDSDLTLIIPSFVCAWKFHYFILFCDWIVLHYMCHIFFIHSPLQKYSVCLRWLDIVNSHLAACAFSKSCFLLKHSSVWSCRIFMYTSLQWLSPFPCHRHHHRIPLQTFILCRFFMTAFHSGAKSCFLEGVTCMSVIIHKVYNFSWTLFLKNSMSWITLEIFFWIVSPVFYDFQFISLKICWGPAVLGIWRHREQWCRCCFFGGGPRATEGPHALLLLSLLGWRGGATGCQLEWTVWAEATQRFHTFFLQSNVYFLLK